MSYMKSDRCTWIFSVNAGAKNFSVMIIVMDKYVKYGYEIKWLLSYSVLKPSSSIGMYISINIPLDIKSYTNNWCNTPKLI